MVAPCPAFRLRLLFVFLLTAFASWHATATGAGSAGSRMFDVPAGEAVATLRKAAQQAGREIMFTTETAQGVHTAAVKGRYLPLAALSHMLAGTSLAATEDSQTGVLAVIRRAPKSEPLPRKPVLSQATAAAPLPEDAIVLSPFEVDSRSDRGYYATNTLAGSRLDTELRDLAASISVMTSEFLNDIAAHDLETAMVYALNVQPEMTDASPAVNGQSFSREDFAFRIRGMPRTSRTRNYFVWSLNSDIFNVERLDYSRGPNSVLFGVSSAGGLVNTTTKQAGYRPFVHLATQVGNHDRTRFTLDANTPLMPNRLALRLNAVQDRRETWRAHEFSESARVHVATRAELLPGTRLRVEFESGGNTVVRSRPLSAADFVSLWLAQGRTPQLAPGQSGAPAGFAVLGAPRLTLIDNGGTAPPLMNLQATAQTIGADGNYDNTAMLRDFSLMPRTAAISGPGSKRTVDYHTYTLYLDHQVFRGLDLEVAYNEQRSDQTTTDAHKDTLGLFADPSVMLPTGEANPNFGRYYVEANFERLHTRLLSQSRRVALSYRWSRPNWGEYRWAGVLSQRDSRLRSLRSVEYAEGSPFAPIPDHPDNRLWRRTYWDAGDPAENLAVSDPKIRSLGGLIEPVTGRSYSSVWLPGMLGPGQREQNRSLSVSGQGHWFDRLLVGTAGYSLDRVLSFQTQRVRDPATGGITFHPSAAPNAYRLPTRTFGLVMHLRPWLSLYANDSTNSALPTFQRIAPDSLRAPPPTGRGRDAGVALRLFGDRVNARINYYDTHASNDTQDYTVSSWLTASHNEIWNALADGGFVAREAADARLFDSVSAGTFDSHTRGWEVEVVAHPRPTLRIFANFSSGESRRSNVMDEIAAFLPSFLDEMKKYPGELVVRNQTPGQLATEGAVAADGLQTLQENLNHTRERFDFFRRDEGRVNRGERNYKGAAFANYTAPAGPLAGFSFGGGLRYQGSNVIGYDPGTNRPHRGNSNLLVDFRAGYEWRAGPGVRKATWTIALNVRNLLDNQSILDIRARGDGAVDRWFFQDPRAWQFSASTRF